MQWIKKQIMRLSSQSRYQKALDNHIKKVTTFNQMSEAERQMQYINIMAEYEHRKISTITVTIILLTFAMVVGQYFLIFIEKAVPLLWVGSGERMEMVAAVLPIVTMLFFLGMVVVLLIIWDCFYELKKALKEKLFVQEFKK